MPIHPRLTSLSENTPAGMTGLSQEHPVLNVGVGSLCGFLWPVLVLVGFVPFAGADAERSVVVAASASANGEAATAAARARATSAKRMLVYSLLSISRDLGLSTTFKKSSSSQSTCKKSSSRRPARKHEQQRILLPGGYVFPTHSLIQPPFLGNMHLPASIRSRLPANHPCAQKDVVSRRYSYAA
jgi:hypothetical protein